MGILDRFLKSKSSIRKRRKPLLAFGRFSDSYKSDAQFDAWDEAVIRFEKEDYLISFQHFFKYLKDEIQENVRYWEDSDGLQFEIFQGSKKISGRANNERIEIETKVASCDELTVEFMRRLMEKNYALKYGRFALDENDDISMKFDTSILDASPYKLYYALKEVAINSDKLDDLLIDEFDMLHPIETGHIQDITAAEKEVKYRYIQEWIQGAFDYINTLNKSEFSAGIAYILLCLVYKLDYLVKPEGFVMEVLERINRTYFAYDNQTITQKCQVLADELYAIQQRPKEEITKELYNVVATFGVTGPVSHERVQSFIDGELPGMNWYIENEYPKIALAITSYIAGYCLFNFSVSQPVREYFHLYFEITEKAFFQDLGLPSNYIDAKNQKLNKSAIRSEITSIAKANKRKFPYLSPKMSLLNFQSLPKFARSYMQMIRQLEMNE